MQLSGTTKFLLKIVLVVYGCLVVLWLANAMISYGKRAVTEDLYKEELALRQEVYLARDKVTLPSGRDIDEEVTRALLANGVKVVENPDAYRANLGILGYLLPDLGALDIRMTSLYGKMEFLPNDWPLLIAIALLYSLGFLGLSLWRFNRKQFT